MLTVPWADLVAGVHLAAVVFVPTGGLLSWRWPRLLWAHVPVAGAAATINLAQARCPLTELELWLRRREGGSAYTGGFIGHYLVQPLYPSGITPGVNLAIVLAATAPNAVAYLVLAARHRRRAAGPAVAQPGQ